MKEDKFKMTPQRAAILEFLKDNKDHPSAEDIFLAVREKYPMVSFTTIYNTLQALKKTGKLWELNIDDERKRYDPNTNLHHHLICKKCRDIVDIFEDFDVSFPRESARDYQIAGYHIEYYGLCGKCRRESDGN